MRIEKAYAIAVKDIREVFSSVGIYGPMIGLPLFFAIVLPVLTLYIALHAAPSVVTKLVAVQIPQVNSQYINGIAFTLFFSVNVLGPIFLTMPILTASVIAADSVIGEKERKTSEALLSMPISTSELLFGKILASFIPTVLLTLAIFILYGTVVNLLAFSSLGAYVLPTPTWLMMLASSPFLAIAAIGIVVFVSAHVKGIKEAQQISTLLVLPVLTIPFISILGVESIDFMFMLYLIIGLAVADFLIIYTSVKRFRKEAML